VDWKPDLGRDGLYVSRCEACGAEERPTEPVRRSRSNATPIKKKRRKEAR
jgi:hypothetical protein